MAKNNDQPLLQQQWFGYTSYFVTISPYTEDAPLSIKMNSIEADGKATSFPEITYRTKCIRGRPAISAEVLSCTPLQSYIHTPPRSST